MPRTSATSHRTTARDHLYCIVDSKHEKEKKQLITQYSQWSADLPQTLRPKLCHTSQQYLIEQLLAAISTVYLIAIASRERYSREKSRVVPSLRSTNGTHLIAKHKIKTKCTHAVARKTSCEKSRVGTMGGGSGSGGLAAASSLSGGLVLRINASMDKSTLSSFLVSDIALVP